MKTTGFRVLFLVLGVLPWIFTGSAPAAEAADLILSLDIGSDLEMSDPDVPGSIDPGDAYEVGTLGLQRVWDDEDFFGVDPPPSPAVPVGDERSLPLVPSVFDLDFSTSARLGYLGPAPDGEVEDHPVVIADAPPLPLFRRADSNADGKADISDAVHVLGHLFLGTAKPTCEKAADTNDDGKVDISDPVFLLGYLFLGSKPPGEPLGKCGSDPTPDELTCVSFAGCP